MSGSLTNLDSCVSLSTSIEDETPTKLGKKRQRQISLVEDISRPILKWPGGKTRLLDDLVKLCPADLATSGGCYFEPFCGGAALLFRLRSLVTRAVLGDFNADLVEFYTEVARDPVGLHACASTIFRHHDAAFYYQAREAWNDLRGGWPATQRAATLLYLNRACFNGLFRLNKAGKNNVPIGKASPGGGEWPSRPSLPRLIAASFSLQGVALGSGDFEATSSNAMRGDFVYFDPPYLPATDRSAFAAYTGGGFALADHERLAAHARSLVDRGVRVMLSSVDTPLAREVLTGFRLTSVTSPRSINSSGAGRGKIGELIATGGYEPAGASS
jgi:DNA adenine methylase